MKNRIELRDYIRFQLAQLGARNGEHEFEQLAFELARQRHVPNLVPATGPVKAGGDQGRDFESYKTFLAGSALGDKVGVVLQNDHLIVGACTLNKKTPAKIRADLKVIFASNEKPKTVFYFCEPNIPVAARHKLQDECRDQYSADLVIFDGLAIADQLADAMTFWIAQHFLSVPLEFFPEETNDDDYIASRKKWLTGHHFPLTIAEFFEVKMGLRATIDEDYAKADMPAWIAVMHDVTEKHPAFWQRQNARYEMIVVQLRGRRDLDPVDTVIDDYFANLPTEPAGPNELLNAATLVSFCHVAIGNKWTSKMTRRRVSEFARLVEIEIEKSMERGPKGADLCLLLEALAGLSVVVRNGEPASTRIEPMLQAWLDVLDAAVNVPHYPVAPLNALIEGISPMMADRPTFQTLRDRVDEFMRTRAGNRAVAESSAKRAQALLTAGNRLAAIDEMHRARVGAFTGEEVPWSVHLMLMLSRAYQDLGLHIAARYYAAGALYMTSQSADEDVYRMWPTAAFALSDCFYTAGEGTSFLKHLGRALTIHFQLANDPGVLEQHDDLQRALVQASLFSTIAKRLVPGLIPHIDKAPANWPIAKDDWDELLALAEADRSPWPKMSVLEIEAVFRNDLGRAPFVDLGGSREYCWRALGVSWTVAAPADEAVMPAMLGLIAVLQITQVELAGSDFLIVPAEARLQISAVETEDFSIEHEGTNEKFLWNIKLPSGPSRPTEFVDTISQALTIVSTVIGHVTALDQEVFRAKIMAVLERGFATRVFAVRPPNDLLEFAQSGVSGWQDLVSLTPYQPTSDISPTEPPELAWKSGPGPGYSTEKAREILENRYRRCPKKIQFTLPRIIADSRLRELLQKRRDAGVLDWQLLVVLMNIVMRMQAQSTMGMAGIRAQMERVHRDERPTDPTIDLNEITDEVIDTELRLSNVYIGQSWGLRVNVETPVFDGMKRLLDERYGNSTDDIAHADILRLA